MRLSWRKKTVFCLCLLPLLLGAGLVCYFVFGKRPEPLNVVLITIDALRADHLGCYGYERNTSPNIDRLAKEGVLFTQAIAQASYTPSSFGAIATSLYPPTNQLLAFGDSIKPGVATLAETLKAHGYRTIFVGGNEAFREGLKGFAEGFSVFYEKALPAKELTQKAVEFLEKDSAAPFFLWIHYMDVHDYNPEAKFRGLFINDPFYDPQKKLPIVKPSPGIYGRNGIPSWLAKKGGGSDNPDHYIALYDEGIRSVDEWAGSLLKQLRRGGYDKNSLIILTADHGEMQGEHGYFFNHGLFLYEPLVRVPFILRGPGFVSAKKVVSQIRASLDVFPTILGLLKIKAPATLDGIDLGQLLKKIGATNPSSLFMGAGQYQIGIRSEAWKLTCSLAGESSLGACSLFHIKTDPGEATDVSAIEKNIFSGLREKLLEYRGRLCPEQEKETKRVMSEQLERALRSLGYLQ